MKIAVAGMGYVGLSLAVLLSQHNEVRVLDVVPEKVDSLNAGKSPIADELIERFLAERSRGKRELLLSATLDPRTAYEDANFAIVATPTNYDDEHNSFDTSSVEAAIQSIRSFNKTAWVIIKSTIPVGYTSSLRAKIKDDRILFSPEFLREGHALYDNLHPSRIIVGVPSEDEAAESAASSFLSLLIEAADQLDRQRVNENGTKGIPAFTVGLTEAEAIKLFSNTFLALRVAYFNELDTYAEVRGLHARDIIKGVCLDPRIHDDYNNPSFGYGGYCLPKDTKQLLANYDSVPQNLIAAIVDANRTRKEHIASEIAHRVSDIDKPLVGIYRLTMKTGSDNFRQSAIQGVIGQLCRRGIALLIYEPTLSSDTFLGVPVVSDFDAFVRQSDLIIANRWDAQLDECQEKVYTRDIFNRD